MTQSGLQSVNWLWLAAGIPVALFVGVFLVLFAISFALNWRAGEPHISGLYSTYDAPDDSIVRGKALVKHRGHRVSIIVNRQLNRNGDPNQAVYGYKGIVKNGVVSATWADTGVAYRIGAIVIKRTDGTGRLAGQTLYPPESSELSQPVQSLHFELRPDKDIASPAVLKWKISTFCWLWLGLG